MNDDELEQLFFKLAERYGIIPEDTKKIIAILVQTTLKHREMLSQKGEPPLTVDETRQALDELMRVLQQQKFSENLSPRIRHLVALWFDQLKLYLFH